MRPMLRMKFWFPQSWGKGVPMGVGMDGVRQGIIQVDGWMDGWLVGFGFMAFTHADIS